MATMTEGEDRLSTWLDANFQREKNRNDPNTIFKRKLLIKMRQTVKRFTDFTKENELELKRDIIKVVFQRQSICN